MSLTKHINHIFSKSSTDERLQFLNICNQYNLFSSNIVPTIEVFLEKFKELLRSPESKKDGLALMYYLIDNCSAEVFSQEGANWIRALSAIIEGNEPTAHKDFSIFLLAKAIPKTTAFPQLSREMSTPYLTPIIHELTKPVETQKSLLANATFCLFQMMKYYPKSCIHHKERILQFLLNQIMEYPHAHINPSYVMHAFSLLPTLDSTNASDSWLTLFTKTYQSIQIILNDIFLNESVRPDFLDQGEAPLQLTIPPNQDFESMSKLSQIVVLITGCLSQLLKTKNIPLSVPVENLIQIFYSMMACTRPLLLDEDMDSGLGHLLVSIMESIFDLLHQLVQSCSSLILTNMDDILKELADFLSETKNLSDTLRKPYCLMRVKLYNLIDSCLLSRHGYSSFDHNLFECIRLDIESKEAASTKLRDASDSKGSSKNQRRVLQNELKANSVQVFAPQMEDLHLLCQSALKVLKTLATLGAVKADNEIENIFLVLMMQNYYNHQAEALPTTSLYKNDGCRQLLYECFLALSSYLPNLNLCRLSQQMFRQGCGDSNLKIRQLCMDALMRNAKAPGKIIYKTQLVPTPTQNSHPYANEATYKNTFKSINRAILCEDDEDMEDVEEEEEDEDLEEEEEEEADPFHFAKREQHSQYTGPSKKRHFEDDDDDDDDDDEEEMGAYARHAPFSSSNMGNNKCRRIEAIEVEEDDECEEEEAEEDMIGISMVDEEDEEELEDEDEEFYEEVVDIKDEEIIETNKHEEHPHLYPTKLEYVEKGGPVSIRREVDVNNERVALKEEDDKEKEDDKKKDDDAHIEELMKDFNTELRPQVEEIQELEEEVKACEDVVPIEEVEVVDEHNTFEVEKEEKTSCTTPIIEKLVPLNPPTPKNNIEPKQEAVVEVAIEKEEEPDYPELVIESSTTVTVKEINSQPKQQQQPESKEQDSAVDTLLKLPEMNGSNGNSAVEKNNETAIQTDS